MWSRTYARSTENSPSSSHARERCTTLPSSTSRPAIDTHKPRRPQSTVFQRSSLGGQVSSHIDSILTYKELLPDRTGSSYKEKVDFPSSPDDIFSDPSTLTLSKAYGSVLQPKVSRTRVPRGGNAINVRHRRRLRPSLASFALIPFLLTQRYIRIPQIHPRRLASCANHVLQRTEGPKATANPALDRFLS